MPYLVLPSFAYTYTRFDFVNKCYKAYESLETRYRVIFTLVVGDIGGVFCVVVVVVDADRLVVNCA